jgi:hypothetical protein
MPAATTAEVAGELVARRTAEPVTVDGQVDAAWAGAELLIVPLVRGGEETAHALDLTLRALYDRSAVYFLAQWPGDLDAGPTEATASLADVVANKFTLHWRIPEPAAQRLDCTVVCHTAHADGRGQFVYANAETIPQGGAEALPVGGRWEAQSWTLEWSRPLISANPYDLQFDDLEGAYPFFVKVFEEIAGQPDPVSARMVMVFGP